jgi:hypothetical protein
MNVEIEAIISQIETMIQSRNPVLKLIVYPRLVISGLNDLNSFAGMKDVKLQIVKTIKSMIVTQIKKYKLLQRGILIHPNRPHFNHIVLGGSPGTGKTSIGMVLCKIICGLGLVKKRCAPQPLAIPNEVDSILALQKVITHPAYSHLVKQLDIHRNDIVGLRSRIQATESQRGANADVCNIFYSQLKRLLGKTYRYQKIFICRDQQEYASDMIRELRQMNRTLDRTRSTHMNNSNLLYPPELTRQHAYNRLEFRHRVQPGLLPSCVPIPLSPPMPHIEINNNNNKSPPKETELVIDDTDNCGCCPNPTVLSGNAPTFIPATHPQTNFDVVLDIEPDDHDYNRMPVGELPFKVCTRDMLVGKFLGHTSPMTKKLLEECYGGVMFIDEAYNMYHLGYSGGDAYGLESLTLICDRMSSHADEIVVVFSGYMDKMQETIFKHQPGLIRRIRWTFEINNYTFTELARIFKDQICLENHKIDEKIDLETFFENNYEHFPHFGGDTQKLVKEVITSSDTRIFDIVVRGEDADELLTEGDLKAGLESFLKSKVKVILDINDRPPPDHMYQ